MLTKKLAIKIILIISIIVIISFSISTYIGVNIEENSLIENEKNNLSILSTTLKEYIEDAMILKHPERINQIVNSIPKSGKLSEINILNENGEIKVSSDSNRINTINNLHEYTKDHSELILKEKIFNYISPVKAKQNCFKCHDKNKSILGYIQIKTPIDTLVNEIKKHRNNYIIVAIITLFIIVLTFIFFIYYSVHLPMKKLVQSMERVEKGDLGTRVNVKQLNEFGKIGEHFNSMLDNLKMSQNEIAKLHEEKIAHVDKLVSLGELSASLAHEIKNPLAGIGATIQVLRSNLAEDSSKVEILDEVINQIDRLNKSVDNLLSFVRSNPIQPVLSDINEILERAFFLVKKQIEMQNIKVDKTYRDIQKIYVDEEQILQVFLNILLNAIQAMPAGGFLLIKSEKVNSEIIVNIKDSGIGIPENVRDKIFEPFFTTKSKGTGLGLSISKRIIELHNGKIQFESVDGKGTSFTIILPVNVKV